MFRILPALALILTAFPTPQIVQSLADKNRVLLIFAPAASDPRAQQQITLLAHHSAEMNERDLVVLPIYLDNGPPRTGNALRELQIPPVSDVEQLSLRRQYKIGLRDFAAILLGKDGGEKLRSSTPLTIMRLNQTIDAMPMRQDEMKRKPPQ
jgi:hypothetical protein